MPSDSEVDLMQRLKESYKKSLNLDDEVKKARADTTPLKRKKDGSFEYGGPPPKMTPIPGAKTPKKKKRIEDLATNL